MDLGSLGKILPSGEKQNDGYTHISQLEQSQPEKQKKSIDEKLREEKQELNQLKKREELKKVRQMKGQLKEVQGGKNLKSEIADKIAPPTQSNTSEDIIEVFIGIGKGVKPEREDVEPFNFEPGDMPINEPNIPNLENLEIPINFDEEGL